MGKKTTLRQLAAELGIAPSTVLRALSGKPSVRQDLRKRIIACAAVRKYTLPNHHTGNVAVITTSTGIYSYGAILLEHLCNELHKEGFRIHILSEADAVSLNDYMYDGVISTTWVSGIEKQYPKEHSLPFVSLNSMDNRLDNIFTVGSDDFEGITLGLQYLYDAGCRRIVFIVSQPHGNRSSTQRVSAFNQFCEAHALPGNEAGFMICSGSNSMQTIVSRAVAIKADAIFYASESAGPELYYELRKLGLRIPKDISVLGMEGHPLNQYLDPPLTSLRQDFEGLARESVRMLKKLIAGETINSGVLQPYTLIKRKSVRKVSAGKNRNKQRIKN